ncbi:hypothetical protein ABFS83_10G075100 [Erythranthe nasuta]
MESSAAAAAASGGGAAEKMKVMVAVDDSDESFQALQWVLDNLSQNYESNLLITIVHVIEPLSHFVYPNPGVHAVFPTTSVIQSVNKAQEEDASAILTHALHICTQRMVKAKTSIVGGDPKEVICNVADQMGVDLIAIGSRGLGKVKRAFMGSVSDYVIHHASCPVLVIKPSAAS